jgi:hypothetical protein
VAVLKDSHLIEPELRQRFGKLPLLGRLRRPRILLTRRPQETHG